MSFVFTNPPASTMDIAGILWPADYGDWMREYHAITAAAGLMDLAPLEWLDVRGTDAASFLQGMLTQDVAAMAVGETRASFVLDENGKILLELGVLRAEAKRFLLQLPPGTAAQLRTRLDRYVIMEAVELRIREDLGALSVQGPESASLLERESLGSPDFLISQRDRCGFGGFDLIAPRSNLAALTQRWGQARVIEPVGMTALNVARIEAFIPWFGADIKAELNPLTFGADRWFSHTKGCYIGQETVAMTRDRGRPPQLLTRLSSTAATPAAAGTALVLGTEPQKDVGFITSSAISPRHGTPLALAILKFQVAEQDGASLIDADHRQWRLQDVCNYKVGAK